MKLNKLLEKQIGKYLSDKCRENEEFWPFIKAVNDSYNSYERDNELSERAFKLTEEEYRDINGRLNKVIEERETSIEMLNETLKGIEGEDPNSEPGKGGLLHIAEFLQRHINTFSETERKLFEQKQFYEQILNQIPADIAVFDCNHRYLFLNPLAVRDPELRKWMIGKNDEEYCDHRNRDHSIARERQKIFNSVVASKKQLEWEEQLTDADGNQQYHLRMMFPVFADNGDLEIMIGYGVNMTDRRKVEEQVKRSEERYRSIFNNSLALICTHDLEGRIMDINSAAVSMLGYHANELKGAPIYNLLPEAKQDDFRQKYLQEIKNCGKATGIMVAMSKAGRKIYLLYQNYLVTEDTQEPYVIGFSQDITQRIDAEQAMKKSEEKYRSIIANMNLGMLEVDTNENIVYANASFCEMSGYEPDELIGKNAISALLKGDNMADGAEIVERRKEGISDAYELKVKNKRGELKWWLISGAPTYDSNGVIRGSVGIHLDITLQKLLEEELRKAKADAEHSALTKEIFLANMSHEIRTPMNAILGIGNLLAKTQLLPQQKSYLGNIQTAANNLLIIINDLLDFSKIESGKMKLEAIGFHLSTVIQNSVQILKYKAEEKGLLIAFKKNNDLAPVLIGDPYRINQVLMNLLSNAIKFTESGHVKIECTLLDDDTSTQQIKFTVSDTGIGMSKDFMSHLFEKFSQEDESITRKYGGTGLGMSITKQLVELMGGKLHVESEKDKGTTISFALKFPRGHEKDVPQTRYANIDTHILKGKKILLAEDNELNRVLATAILSDYGAEVSEAENGSIAIEQLTKTAFDLVLMDVQMPVKDGLETTRYIRANISKGLPIIAMTASAQKKQEELCLAAGMNDFISKPFNEGNLVQLIGKWLGRDTTLAINKASAKRKEMPLFDLSKLIEISRGSDEFVKKMVNLFIEKTPPLLQQMDEAYAAQNWAAIAALAHRTKTSINIMCIESLNEDLELLEDIAGKTPDDSFVYTHLSHIKTVINEVISELRTF